MIPSAATPPRNEASLATLLQLEKNARACTDTEALAFQIVNDTHALTPYRQAALWQDGRIVALSGLAVPDPHAPFNVWLAQLLSQHAGAGAAKAAALQPTAEQDAMWREHLPAHAWWLPLDLGSGDTSTTTLAALVLWRDTPWLAHEQAALALLADTYGHAWRALQKHTPTARSPRALWASLRQGGPRKRLWWALALAGLALMFFPVRQSVLAPAEIVARAPAAVRAPLQGVVDRIAVSPNQTVEAGQLLAALDARELEGRLESARQALAVADAELRQGQQQALLDERSKATLALLQGKRNQAAADEDYLNQALARTQLRAERAGVAIFDDPSDWIGKPVALGERIMMVADPKDAQLEVHLPVADAIALPEAATVQLFLNTAPASPLSASLLRVGYRAAPIADGSLAYRVRAGFSPEALQRDDIRVGLKGTAKIYGERTFLFVYVLRRPLATLRVWLGI